MPSRPWRLTRVVGQPTPAGRHRVLPATASLAVILNTADCPSRPPAFVHAPHAAPVQFDGECSASYVQVTVSPPVAVRLLGAPLGSLGESLVDLSDVFGPAGRRIVEQLRAEPDPARQAALLDDALLRWYRSGPDLTPQVGHVWRRLTTTDGDASIGQLAGEVGWTHQHLIDRFRREVGTTPKVAARLLRLNRLWRLLDRSDTEPAGDAPGPRWADLAAEAGYADQSHLIREFRRFTGTTPTRYLERRRPGRHGGPLAAAAGDRAAG